MAAGGNIRIDGVIAGSELVRLGFAGSAPVGRREIGAMLAKAGGS